MPNFIRKSNRLPQELYQKDSWYFVTVCVMERKCIFVEKNFNSPLELTISQKLVIAKVKVRYE